MTPDGTPDALKTAAVKVVKQALESIAFLEATPRAEPPSRDAPASWSWVKVVEPSPGTVAIAHDPALGAEIARGISGGDSRPPTAEEIADVQAELANVVAGRLVAELLGKDALLSLGIPRTGRGAPDVRELGWTAQHFLVGERWLSTWVHGPVFAIKVQDETTASSITPEPVTPTTKSTSQSARSSTSQLVIAIPPSATGSGTGTWAGLADVGQPLGPDDPQSIGQYQLLRKIGEGGMGVVYQARHIALDRIVALKVMRPEVCQDEKFVARFMREARIAATIDHPNVVTVYDAGQENGRLFMALRYVPGGDLASKLLEMGTLPETDALDVVGRCLLGLEAVHACGMVHRDIKPANVLLDRDGSPRLADLGLARSTRIDDGLSHGSGPQGTPSYMSPEQARGVGNLDIRSDIYSLGMMLYALLAGAPAFHGDSAYETVAQVLYSPPMPLRSRNARISAAVEKLVMKAIEKKAEDRFQTPLEFLAAVEEELQRLAGKSSSRFALPGGRDGAGDKAADPATTHWFGNLFRSRPKNKG